MLVFKREATDDMPCQYACRGRFRCRDSTPAFIGFLYRHVVLKHLLHGNVDDLYLIDLEYIQDAPQSACYYPCCQELLNVLHEVFAVVSREHQNP
jgi:hypothetical protein